MTFSVRGKRVLLYGDSQMQGLYPKLREILLRSGASEVIVQVQQGLKLSEMPSEQRPRRADVAIVSGGGNLPPRTIEAASSQMDALLSLLPREVAWISVVPSTDPELEQGRSRMRSFQKEHLPSKGVTVIDSPDLVSGLPMRDSVHFTREGYQSFASRVAGALSTMVQSSAPFGSILATGVAAGVILAVLIGRKSTG